MIGATGMSMPLLTPIGQVPRGGDRAHGAGGLRGHCRRFRYLLAGVWESGALSPQFLAFWRLGLIRPNLSALKNRAGGGRAWLACAMRACLVAMLYALGAHGIMTLNDFKALEGDRQTGLRSLPVTLGPKRAAHIACWIMLIPQLAVVMLLMLWAVPNPYPAAITALILGQLWAMRVMLRDPKAKAPWYNGTGVMMYVSGMLITAFALRFLGEAL